jgi:hypothetical protein
VPVRPATRLPPDPNKLNVGGLKDRRFSGPHCSGRRRRLLLLWLLTLHIPSPAGGKREEEGKPDARMQCGVHVDWILPSAETNSNRQIVTHC